VDCVLIPHLLITSLDLTSIQHEPLEGSALAHTNQALQHQSSPVYDDADADGDVDEEYFNSIQPDSVQHNPRYGPSGAQDGRVTYAGESQIINQPSFGQHGSKDQSIELDDLEDELDDTLNFRDNIPDLRSHQPVRTNTNVRINDPSTVPVTSSIAAPRASISRPSSRQSVQSYGQSYGPVYPPQTQPSAATRPSDAGLAKHHADKKSNKARENAFEIHGRWWHRTNENEAAGMDVSLFDPQSILIFE